MATPNIESTDQPEQDEPSFRTWTERREQIVRDGDADAAINATLGTLHAIHGQALLLHQDIVRDHQEMLLSVAHAIIELADAARDFLDRPRGWSQGEPGPLTGDGDQALPKELEPAKALYARLAAEGDAMTTEAVIAYLKRPGDRGVMEASDDDFAVLETNVSRHGLSFEYALRRLEWILRKVETEEVAQ